MLKVIFALLGMLLATGMLDIGKPISAASSYSQSNLPVTFEAAGIENAFPESLTFHIVASSAESEISSATLFFATRDGTSTTRQVVEVEPASQVELSYSWDTSNVTMPPSTPIIYHWEVVDSSGNRVSSPEELVFYDDIRYEWNILEDENIAIWWHDRPISFGGQVFEIAQEAFNRQRMMFRVEPEYQMKIIVYNDVGEFAEWHSFYSEFIGGQAFPAIAVTTQIVSANTSVESWLTDVVPHEISHLYFYQATNHAFSSPPLWLNEGLAQLNEFSPNTNAMEFAERAIENGDLLPLWSLSGSFGTNEANVRLAYAESLSAAAFLLERYGRDGISKLLGAYKSGLTDDEALLSGLGVSLVEFQQEWLTWMGVDPERYPAPTAEPTLVWPTAPSYTLPTKNPTRSAPAAEETPPGQTSPAPSATVVVTEAPIVAEVVTKQLLPTPKATPTTGFTATNEDLEEKQENTSICGAMLFPLLAAAFISFRAIVPSERKHQIS